MPDAGSTGPNRDDLLAAEEYLRQLNLPTDDWLLDPAKRKPFYTPAEAAGNLLGLSGQAIRNLAESGEIPLATNPLNQWKIDWWGLVWYVAQERRKQQRSQGVG